VSDPARGQARAFPQRCPTVPHRRVFHESSSCGAREQAREYACTYIASRSKLVPKPAATSLVWTSISLHARAAKPDASGIPSHARRAPRAGGRGRADLRKQRGPSLQKHPTAPGPAAREPEGPGLVERVARSIAQKRSAARMCARGRSARPFQVAGRAFPVQFLKGLQCFVTCRGRFPHVSWRDRFGLGARHRLGLVSIPSPCQREAGGFPLGSSFGQPFDPVTFALEIASCLRCKRTERASAVGNYLLALGEIP
jgi:hypothetical protein